MIQFGDISFDTVRRELRMSSEIVPIEPKVFDLLEYLIQNRERVVGKDELVETVWGGRFISDSAISSAVKFARKAVGDDGKKQHTIKTVFGRGFRFVRSIRDQGHPVDAGSEPLSGVGSRPAPTNLSHNAGLLVGRDDEIARLTGLVQDRALVSVVGPGGAGKTTLAKKIAWLLRNSFPGGVWFCELSSANDAQVESVVLGTLDRSSGAGPVDTNRIAERIGGERTLLVLDNCEHVIDTVAQLTSELTEMLPELAILTTSREALDILGEQVLRIAGLGYNSGSASAVELFRNRANELVSLDESPDSEDIIRKIVKRLEGLPLAIELAVPRLVSSTLKELLDDLENQLPILASRRRTMPGRHSTMDDAIAWSFHLLDDTERKILLSLSSFLGAFTIESAKAVCCDDETAEVLHRLVQKSVVVHKPNDGESRFKLLEPIRQFAERQLSAEQMRLSHQRHAVWFGSRVQALAENMWGSQAVAASETLTTEWPDLGRALKWGRDNNRPEIAIDPLVALHIQLLWQLRIEGFEWLEAAVQACDVPPDKQAVVDLVRSMGSWSAGDLELSESHLEASVARGGETAETMYFRFYQSFAREDFSGVFAASEAAWDMARSSENAAWKTTTSAFRIIGRTLRDPGDPMIPSLFDDLEIQLAKSPWPTGECCALLARVTFGFMSGNSFDGEAYREQLDRLADTWHVPWFKITASGVGPPPDDGHEDAIGVVARSAQTLRVAIASGDVMQLPTLIRFAVIALWDIGDTETAAKIIGLVPRIRGLGEKGTMAPGYDETVKQVRETLPLSQLKELLAQGSQLSLEEAAAALDTAVKQRAQRDTDRST